MSSPRRWASESSRIRRWQGAHLLDWHGSWQEVTFNPRLFDEHPNTLKLLSYGSGLLEDVLSIVESPTEDRERGVIARCTVDGRASASGYFRLSDASGIASLGELQRALDDSCVTRTTPQRQQELETQFVVTVDRRVAQHNKAANDRHQAQLSSLMEEMRQLLVEAAYIELALSQQIVTSSTKSCRWIFRSRHTTD